MIGEHMGYQKRMTSFLPISKLFFRKAHNSTYHVRFSLGFSIEIEIYTKSIQGCKENALFPSVN